jgi:hypothetical protein
VPPSDAISTRSTDLATNPLAASAPRLCQATLPTLTRVTFAPTLPSAKLSSISTCRYTSPSSNDPTHVRHADENSLTNTTCATTSVFTTQTGSRSSSANTAISDQIGNRIWSATLSSCMPAQVWMHRSPAICQNQSPGGLLSRFLKHIRPSHTLRTRTFNLAVG